MGPEVVRGESSPDAFPGDGRFAFLHGILRKQGMDMHIGLAIEHFRAAVGGAEAFAVMVVRKLAGRGHRISVAAPDGEGIEGIEGIRFHRVALRDAPACFAREHADVVVDWGLNIPADLHRLGGGVHGEYLRLTLEARTPALRLIKRLGCEFSLKHRRVLASEAVLLRNPNTHFLAVSHFVARQVRAAAGVAPDRVTVLINGVDAERFSPLVHADKREQIRSRFGFAREDVVCLLVAHNLWLKNLGLLTDLFPALAAAEPRLRLMLLGKRDPRLRAPWFTYAGSSPTPEHYYAAADVLVHPTRYDACANVVLEAMASGKPVLSSDRNGSSEVIESGQTGFVLPVVGPSADIKRQWGEPLLGLAREEETRLAMGGRARDFIRTHQTVDGYVDRLEGLLQSLTEPSRQVRPPPTTNLLTSDRNDLTREKARCGC